MSILATNENQFAVVFDVFGRERFDTNVRLPKNVVDVVRSYIPEEAAKIHAMIHPFSTVTIQLPEDPNELHDALLPLRNAIERAYVSLPWPERFKKIVVLTQVLAGRGDIAAAAKAIGVMQQLCPGLIFDWVLTGGENYNPRAFLHCHDLTKVHIRQWSSPPTDKTPADFLLVGPVKCDWDKTHIEEKIGRRIKGLMFSFMENAEKAHLGHYTKGILKMMLENREGIPVERCYEDVHSFLFATKVTGGLAPLPMGMLEGTGVFLDQSRIQAPLTRGYCCPSYLLHIKDKVLRRDILEAMDVFDNRSEPNYHHFSFNSGYAHRPISWAKFIDCVAMHEKNKHVVIVLNQKGEFDHLSTREFQKRLFTSERLAFLKKKGYGSVILKGEEARPVNCDTSVCTQVWSKIYCGRRAKSVERRFVVIVRSSFAPSDMRCMQLASERLLATGDNSAVEAWCARCKLYLYEDVANWGCKWRFLQQQVDLARKIKPALGDLLALFGGDRRDDPVTQKSLNPIHRPFNGAQMKKMEALLNTPGLSSATLQFCEHIVNNYSFDEVLSGALKRAAWHHIIPALAQIESQHLDKEFRIGLVKYIKNPVSTSFSIETVPAIDKLVFNR